MPVNPDDVDAAGAADAADADAISIQFHPLLSTFIHHQHQI